MFKRYFILLVIFIISIIDTVFAVTIPTYKRDDYGKTWAIVNTLTKIDTRDSILIRDNKDPKSKCTFVKNKITVGRWVCPYCGVTFTIPSKMDIDHVVPLSEAHKSGAWAWTPAKKNSYYNSLKTKTDLLAVCYDCNRTKGDSDPVKWMPKINRVKYIKNWVAEKKRWNLNSDSLEIKFINKTLNK